MDALKDKIITGYLYYLGTGEDAGADGFKWVMATGREGVWNYIDTCREMGLPDFLIEEGIKLSIGNQKYISISELVVKHKDDGPSEG